MNTSTAERPKFSDMGPSVKSFEEYFDSHKDYIMEVQELMAKHLEDDPVIMDGQARDCESHKTRMRSILSFADAYLDMAQHQALLKIGQRDKDFTDLDRDKAMAAAVVRERRFRDVVKGICDSMSERVSYCQTRLRIFGQMELEKFST